MIPTPGESPDDWWHNTGFSEAVRVQAARDGGSVASGCVAERADQVRPLQPGPLLPAGFFRLLTAERLGIVPDEIAASHCVALSRPKELADMLEGYAATAPA